MSIPSGSVVGSGEVPSVLGRLVPVPLWSKSFSYFDDLKEKKKKWVGGRGIFQVIRLIGFGMILMRSMRLIFKNFFLERIDLTP